LAENKQEQERLRQELLESQKQLEAQQENYIAEQSKLKARTQELDVISHELAAVRTMMATESLQGQKLAERVVEVERAKAELGKQADAARDLVNAKENFIGSLDSQIQQRQEKVDRLESLLRSETAQRQQEQSRAEALEKQIAELTGQLAEKVEAQKRWHQRQSVLKQCIRRRKDQITHAVATAVIGEDKLKSLNSIIDDLRVIQSALCSRVRELTTQHDVVSQRVHELDDQSRTAAQTIQARDQQIAALRHAILDAAHLGTNVSRERLRVERQMVKGWKRLMATLLHTPLSTRQRGLIAETLGALEGWDTGRAEATKGFEFRVEPPDLRRSEFNFAKVIEGALAAVRENADETGTKVKTALVGAVPELVRGNAQQIHQLITTLAASLPRYGHAKSLEVKISFEAKSNGTAGMLLSLLLSPAQGDGTLRARLTTLAKQSATLRAVRRGGAKLALSSAWQLALALGGNPSIETTAERKVRVLIPLPLLVTLSLVSENETGQSSAATNGEAAHPSGSGRTPVAGHGRGQRK
jgi:hypothetical protein